MINAYTVFAIYIKWLLYWVQQYNLAEFITTVGPKRAFMMSIMFVWTLTEVFISFYVSIEVIVSCGVVVHYIKRCL